MSLMARVGVFLDYPPNDSRIRQALDGTLVSKLCKSKTRFEIVSFNVIERHSVAMMGVKEHAARVSNEI